MFKNRLTLIFAAFFILIVSLAIARPLSDPTKLADISSMPEPVTIPVTGAQDLSDYYQRHARRTALAEISADLTDYFARHPELRSGLETVIHPVLQNSPIDECFDVSVSELTACREASQSASQ